MSDVTAELAMEANDKAMEIARLKDDNAKLQNDADLLRAMLSQVQTEKRCYMAENSKLRELVRDMRPFVKEGWVHACPNRECCLFEECDADSEYECLIEEHMVGRMRELGVEGTE